MIFRLSVSIRSKRLLAPTVVLLGLLLSGCGNDPIVTGNSVKYGSLKHARKGMNNSRVVCQDKADCPGYVASVVYVDRDKESPSEKYIASFCSGQLISSNRVLTNWHCLPDAKNTAGSDCSDWVSVKFPETNSGPAIEVGCKSVVASDGTLGNTFSADWAVIELDQDVDRPIVELDFSGIADQAEVISYPNKYQFLRNKKGITYGLGVVTKRTCTTDMGSLFATYYTSEKSVMFSLKCVGEIIPGMSGAGITSGGRVVGVLSATGNPDGEAEYRHQTQSIQRRAAMGTNLSCVGFLNTAGLAETCDFVPEPSRTPLMNYARIFYSDYRTVKQDIELWDEQSDLVHADLRLQPTSDSPAGQAFADYLTTNQDLAPLLTPGTESPHRDEVMRYVQLARHPYFPACVEASAGDDFAADLPFLLRQGSSLDTFEMNEFGEISFPEKPDSKVLRARFTKQPSGDYLFTIPKVDTPEVRAYMTHLIEYRQQSHDCREALVSRFACERAAELRVMMEQIEQESVLSEASWETQIWLAAYQDSPQITLPVCN